MSAIPLTLTTDTPTWNALLLALRTSGSGFLRDVCRTLKISSAELPGAKVRFGLPEATARCILDELATTPAIRTVLAEIARQLALRDQDRVRATAWSEYQAGFVSASAGA